MKGNAAIRIVPNCGLQRLPIMKPIGPQRAPSVGQYHGGMLIQADGWFATVLFQNNAFNSLDWNRAKIRFQFHLSFDFLSMSVIDQLVIKSHKTVEEMKTWPDIQYTLVCFLYSQRTWFCDANVACVSFLFFWWLHFLILGIQTARLPDYFHTMFNYHTLASVWSCMCTQSGGATNNGAINSCVIGISSPN